MPKPLSLHNAMHHIGRREFLRLLCGSAAGIVLEPTWKFNLANKAIPVPPTLMLHSKNRWQLVNIVKWLTANGYSGINYRQLNSVLQGHTTLPDKPVILSLDDLDTIYIERYFMEMVDLMENAGYLGVLGIITTKTPKQNPKSWQTLNELAARGWELDTHTTHHALLPPLKREEMRAEIVDSANMIADAVDLPATTLIVPYANIKFPKGKIDQRIFDVSAEANLQFVVGMAGGRHIQPDAMPPYYVGRVGVGTDAVQTGNWIRSFNREPDNAEG